MVNDQGDVLIDDNLKQIDTSAIRRETEAQLQEMSASYENSLKELQDSMKQLDEQNTMTADETVQLQNLLRDIKKVKEELEDEKEELAKVIEDFEDFKKKVDDEKRLQKVNKGVFQNGTMAIIMCGASILFSKIALYLIYKKWV